MAGLRRPSPMLHPQCRHRQRTGQGQGYWLGLPCKTLSFFYSKPVYPGAFSVHFYMVFWLAQCLQGFTNRIFPGNTANLYLPALKSNVRPAYPTVILAWAPMAGPNTEEETGEPSWHTLFEFPC